MQALPIDSHCSRIATALREAGRLVLTATPGAGKSTRIPPALLNTVSGRVMVLQPRRAAARQLARRVAGEQGWSLGEEIGFHTRFERNGGEATRLWYATAGILRRRLHDDPTLEGIGCLVLDEFHERGADTDVLLSWVRQLRETGLRDDLQLLVMSATMDAQHVADFLDGAPVIEVPGNLHPIRSVFQAPRPRERLEQQVLRAVREYLKESPPGDVLVFLPGVGEIRGCARSLAENLPGWRVQELHGSQPADEQDAVLADHGSGPPRIICATNIAETSLTVPGVRCVIDAGLQRVDRYDAATGFQSLELESCTAFQADQRRGRAGRLGPGLCVRLWSRIEDSRRPPSIEPEVCRGDPLPLVLDLKAWWGSDPTAFPWLDAPRRELFAQVEEELRDLELLEDDGRLNHDGRRLAALPLHPRLSRLLLVGELLDELPLAAACAALIDGRDVLRDERPAATGDDLTERLALLQGVGGGADRGALHESRRVRDDLLRQWGWRGERDPGRLEVERLLGLFARAWPDRIAVRSGPGANRVRLPGARVLQIDERSQCHLPAGRRDQGPVIALRCKRLRGRGGARNVLGWGLACSEEELLEVAPDCFAEHQELAYDAERGVVRARRSLLCGRLVLRVLDESKPPPAVAAAALVAALAPRARELAEADERLGPWLQRYAWLQTHGFAGDDWPLLDEAVFAALLADLSAGCSSLVELRKADWLGSCKGRLDWGIVGAVDELAPASVSLPNGREARLDYAAEPGPVLQARMQEFFGCRQTPRIAGGRHPVVLHLCAPNGRPQQITDDLAGFWERTWPQVRKDLRGRYVKHPWPEDPLAHPPCTPSGKPIWKK